MVLQVQWQNIKNDGGDEAFHQGMRLRVHYAWAENGGQWGQAGDLQAALLSVRASACMCPSGTAVQAFQRPCLGSGHRCL